MIAIDNVILSDEIVESYFSCDLQYCKGACCEDGDAGAPITEEEKIQIQQFFPAIQHLLAPENINIITQQGLFLYDDEFGWVTPTIPSGMCVFGYKNNTGQIICAYEKAFMDKKINWQKPISCHLFPIKQKITQNGTILLNYEPRKTLCREACIAGKQQKIPVYVFLQHALVRAFGKEFYKALTHIATNYFKNSAP